MMTDPIADMLSRIRNAQLARKPEVSIPFSKVKMAIAQILEREGYVGRVEKIEDRFGAIMIRLKYQGKQPAISEIHRISSPGHRRYVKSAEIRSVLNGYGIAVISTPQGMMTNKEARQRKLGGEIICEIS